MHFSWKEKVLILIKLSLKFVPKGPINNNPASVQIMAWHRISDKPLCEPILTWFTDPAQGGDEIINLWNHNSHPISRPHKRTIGCLLWICWRNLNIACYDRSFHCVAFTERKRLNSYWRSVSIHCNVSLAMLVCDANPSISLVNPGDIKIIVPCQDDLINLSLFQTPFHGFHSYSPPHIPSCLWIMRFPHDLPPGVSHESENPSSHSPNSDCKLITQCFKQVVLD